MATRKKYTTWGEQVLPETLDDLIKAYKSGLIGAGSDKESEEALRHDCRQMFGADTLEDIATANGWGDSGAGKLVLSFLHAEKLWPGCFPGTRQFVGSCVSHGQTKAMLITLACELTSGMPDPVTGQLEGPPEVPTSSFATGVLHPSPIYWTRGYNGHGWSCSTSARNSVNKVGGVVCKKYPFYDLSEITRDIECLYGSRQPPDDWQKEFSSHLVRGAAEINSFEAIRDALYNGYGVNSCGSEGFSSTRDENGVSKRSGGWAHSMAYTAVDDRDVIKQLYKTRGLVLIQNSWAKWNSGPRRIYGTNYEIPHGSFWARWEDISRRYAVAMSNFNGWPVQILPGYGEDALLN